jgi:molecular chaperone HtpG
MTNSREKAKNFVLLKNTEGAYATLDEYREKVQANQTDKNESLVLLYTTDTKQQHAYIESATGGGYDVLLMDNVIDLAVDALEQKLEKVRFQHLNADTLDKLIDKGLNNESVCRKLIKRNLKEVLSRC